jgi:nucleolar protein 14
LKAENKAKLAAFVVALVDHMHHVANTPDTPAFDVLEQVTRHVHSMAKTYPVEVGNAFRRHLQDLHQSRALSPNAGDLVILSAIGSIFPTSDHFHQVVTPAMLTIGRYLGQKIPVKLSDYATGTYLATLALSYQDYSKRYVPEVLGYLLNTLCALAPVKLSDISGSFPYHEPKSNFRLNGSRELAVRAPTVADTIDRVLSDQDTTALEAILMETSIRLLDVASDTWTAKPSFFELFESVSGVLKHLETRPCQGKLPQSTQVCY